MNTIIRDECLQNLFYAQEAMKEWIPMTEYEVIFEAAENSETAEKVAKNEATATKSVGFVKKAINAVISLIKRIYYAIKDLIDRCTMSGAEREAFDAFRATMAQDPSMKNKKVTVRDFRKIEAEYDKIIAEIDQNIRSVKADEKHPIENITKKVNDFTKGFVTELSVTVAADAALKMADSNVAMAKLLSKTLKDEEGVMEGLVKALGKRDAIKFQKEIDAAAKNTLLHQLKVKIFRHKYDNLKSCIDGTIKTMTHAGFREVKEVKGDIKSLKADYKAGKISKEEYKARIADLKDDLSEAKHYRKDSINMDKRLLKTDHVGTAVKTTVKTTAGSLLSGAKEAIKDEIVDAGKSARKKADKAIKDNITDRNREKRNKSGVYKSGFDFITGRK